MLSSHAIKNVSDASHYYSQKDNYYTREEGFEQSEWYGKGAEKLHLSGGVDSKQFTELLQGKLPSGEQLGKMVEGEIKHRPGWDLTFSAPKSASLLAFLGGDRRLIKAHIDAVHATFSTIERSCAQARIKTIDGVIYQNTNNLVAALHHHDVSRLGDPQMHTHCVVMNMTKRSDGEWRSLASQMGRHDEKAQREINGFIERVRHHNRYFSKVYEMELAFRVKELGYEITTDTKSGIFEIAGISREVIEHFSKRREEIEKKLDEKGLSGGKAAAIATLDTREAKKDIDRIQLKEKWLQEAKELGFDCKKMIDASHQREKVTTSQDLLKETDSSSLAAISQAAKNLSIFQTTFTLEEVVTQASSYAIHSSLKIDDLLLAIDAKRESGELIPLANEQGKTMFMAKSTLDDEKCLINQLKNNKSLQSPVDIFHLNHFLTQHTEISSEYHEHLKTIFNNDRIVLVEGNAAKETLVNPIMKIARSNQLEVAILSPNLVGSKVLAKQSKLAPQNLWEQVKSLFVDTTPKHYSVMQFLSEFDEKIPIKSNNTPDLLIVDNAHLLSTYQKARLTEWNFTNNRKLILLGNKDTLLPQQVGVSINQLTEQGVKTISIKDKFDANLFKLSINKISENIVEVKDANDRYRAIAKHYIRLNEEKRFESWLVVNNKTASEHLNILTHDELKTNNKLGKGISINILIPIFIPEGKGIQANTYQKNQIIRFNETYSSLSIERGEYLRIIQHNKEANRVVLQNKSGQKIIWQPDKVAGMSAGKIELFAEKERELCVGERIILYRSIKSKNIVKGEHLTITKIHPASVTLKNSDGKSLLLDLKKMFNRHMDYGYATTPHAIVHEKSTYIIADLPSRSFHTDQRRFNQIITQSKEAWIYTDDHKSLVAHLEKKTGDRLTANETLSKAENIKKNLHSLYDVLEKKIANQKGFENSKLSHTAIEAVEYAMHHLAEREAGFTHKQLMETAINHALGKVTQDTLLQATKAMKEAGILIKGKRDDGTLWTTADAVKIEREIIAWCNQDKGKLEPIVGDALLEKYCDPNILKPEQIAAIKAITQTNDRVMAIQGYPGTGKTTMLATVADVLAAKNVFEGEHYKLLGLAPTNKAVSELKKRGIDAQTLDSFIIQVQRERENHIDVKKPQLILVIDEASMVSNRRALEILKISHELNCRLIPVGDVRQNPSVEAGKAHDLIQTQVDTKKLTDIQRQKNPLLIQAVDKTIKYEFKAAFTTLKNSIIEVNEKIHPPTKKEIEDKGWNVIHAEIREKRIDKMVADFFSYPKEEWDNIQIITPGHDDRILTNDRVRIKLKECGILKDKDQSFTILNSKSFTRVKCSYITNFEKGDILRFSKSEAVGIKAGEYLTVINTEHHANLLVLKKTDGQELVWQVPTFNKKRFSGIEVFKSETRELQAGDKIRWLRTDKKNELFSTEPAIVTHVEKNKITGILANQKVFTFNPQDPKYQHWDHGYAATVYAVQADTKNIILAHLESYRKNLTNQPSFMVELTRAVNEFRLYTDNADRLLKMVIKNHGMKMSSLEVIGEYPSAKPFHQIDLANPKIINQVIGNHKESPLIQQARQLVDPIVSNKTIDDFAKKIVGEGSQNYKSQLNAYKAITPSFDQSEIQKTITKIKDVEREI